MTKLQEHLNSMCSTWSNQTYPKVLQTEMDTQAGIYLSLPEIAASITRKGDWLMHVLDKIENLQTKSNEAVRPEKSKMKQEHKSLLAEL